MTSLLILGSCHELQEIPIAKEESIEIKFDRLQFLGAVSEASKEYALELRNPVKNKNFRTIYDTDVVIHDYIDNIATRLNTSDDYFKTIPESSWNDPYQGQTFANEITLDKSALSPRVKIHIDNYENAINSVVNRYESGLISENQLKNELKSVCQNRGNSIKSDGNIPVADREDISEIFYVMDEMTDDLLLVLQDPAFENAFIKSRLGRALARVLLVAAVTAAIYFTGGIAASIIKAGSIHSGVFKAGLTAITKSTKIVSGGKLYSGLMMGLGKGTIQAAGRWDQPWEGITKEAKYGIKLAW